MSDTKIKSIGIAIFLCLTSAAFADVVTFGVTSGAAPNGSSGVMGGVYTSPYTGNVNGGPNIPAICDDFSDDVNPPEYWKALATNLANLDASTTDDVYWDQGQGATQQQAYMVVAYLAEEILGTTDETLRGELSFALWEVFDPAAASDLTSVQQNGGGGYEGAGKYLLDAQNAVQANITTLGLSQYLSTFSNITIYSATTNNTTAEVAGTAGRPQEFIVVNMPEPESIAMLGLDLLGMSALVLFLRRRSACRRSSGSVAF